MFQRRAKGSELLEQVFQYLELSERDYFGLLFPQKPGDVVVRVYSTALSPRINQTFPISYF